jgi:hypothetical protein
MDLRGFQAHNAGCRYELSTLARTHGLARVVVLVGKETDRAAAAADTTGSPPGRFLWLETTGSLTDERRDILESLLGSSERTRLPARPDPLPPSAAVR